MVDTTLSKHVAISSGLTEAEIRPPALMSEFKRLSIRDATEFFSEPGNLQAVACPACDAAEAVPAFSKYDFLYVQCSACASLYVSPRPSPAALERYYAESSASRFRAQHFSRSTAQARRQHLLRSLANWMGQRYEDLGNPEFPTYADVRTYSPQVFEEVHALELFRELYTLDPLLQLPEEAGIPVRRGNFEEARDLGVISAFEKMEHEFSPHRYLERLRAALAEGGLLFFTTRTINGFDLQVLWDKTPYIFVPEHLNLLSLAGLRTLLDRAGFDVIELSTPGQLDVQLVQHARQQDPSIRLPRFIAALLDSGSGEALEDFQSYLQKHRLSSHVRVAAKKRA